jgi:hypothetical protein
MRPPSQAPLRRWREGDYSRRVRYLETAASSRPPCRGQGPGSAGFAGSEPASPSQASFAFGSGPVLTRVARAPRERRRGVPKGRELRL